ncbi:hypothetical protein PQJ75_02130 [Rhodoplanes sp. TEM]|uniref:Uncharacterized protein n=1 Tax=Rhodoplanes tepidamans TaxID=200616 RepID=A0ABT5J6N3_RHOTP|nr:MULTISPECIES: hypothetical protein [Rhodoplanes]MDC7785046.1 hypothetical protein [Rhodoplanes tepidamans]MDC7982520.1 hypothetical protein [Rhodoplanes sp. TEM]MDQ0356534.1 hypothetical protein [Rhodoplanes tepidamans]
MRGARPGFLTKMLFLNAGLVLWAAHFGFVYGLTGVVCARGLGTAWPAAVPFVVAFATVVAAGLSLVVLFAAVLGRGPGIAGEPDPALRVFWRSVTGGVAVFGFVAIVWSGLPAVLIRPCA